MRHARLVYGLAGAAAVAAAGLALATRPGPEHPVLRVEQPALADGTDQLADPQPGWLPAGARRLADPPELQAPDRRVAIFELPGPANADTTETTSPLPGAQHPPTVLTVIVEAGDAGSQPFQMDHFWTVSPVQVGGHQGWLATFYTGYGDRYLRFSDGRNTYTVESPRYVTSDGPSGVSVEDLRHVAESLLPAAE